MAGGPSLHSIPYGHHQPLQGSTSAVNRQELNNDEADSTPTVTTATSEDGSSSNRSSAADAASTSAVHQARPPSEANVGHDYQTMDSRLNSFRPADMGNVRPDVQKRSLPSVPPMLPSDPGYARPFVSAGMVSRPPDPPPTPPTELPPSRPPATTGHLLFSNPPLETSLDDDSTALNAVTRGRRSRSVGQMLETNFDEEGSESGGAQQTQQPPHESTPLKNNGHSRSLGESGLFKLSVGDELLESDL